MHRLVAIATLLAACSSPPPAPPPPDPALGRWLHADAFPAAPMVLRDFAPTAANAVWSTGDSVLFGLRLQNGDTEHRWLLRLSVRFGKRMRTVPNTAPGAPPAAPIYLDIAFPRQSWNFTRTINGEVKNEPVEAEVLPTAVEVFDADDGHSLGKSLVSLPAELLGSGLLAATHAAQDLERLDEVAGPASAAATDRIAELARTYARGLIATVAMLQVVQEDSVLADYFWQVVEKPSLWSILAHFGAAATISIPFEQAVPAAGAPPGQPPADELRVVPISVLVNDAPALFVDLLVGPSARPYSLCGGVRGASAHSPTRQDLHFDLVLLAAALGEETTATVGPTTIDVGK